MKLLVREMETLSPVLRAVIDVQHFDDVGFHCIDHNIRKRRDSKFSCTATVTRSASVCRRLQTADSLIDCANGGFCKLRIVLQQVVLDVLEIVGGRCCPTDAH